MSVDADAAPAATAGVNEDSFSKVRGDTQGAAVVVEEATVTIGNNDLLEGEPRLCDDRAASSLHKPVRKAGESYLSF